MAKDTITILFQLAWELAKAALYLARRNTQPPPRVEQLTVMSAPPMPPPAPAPEPVPVVALIAPAPIRGDLGTALCRQRATIAMLMHAYEAHVTPAQLMAIEKRSEAPYGFWITPNRKLKIGPFSFN